MSYKIRYGFDRHRQNSAERILWIQSVVSIVLLGLTALTRGWDGADQLLSAVMYPQAATVGERAVVALSGALAQGVGWYQALAVWCRTIIDGAA